MSSALLKANFHTSSGLSLSLSFAPLPGAAYAPKQTFMQHTDENLLLCFVPMGIYECVFLCLGKGSKGRERLGLLDHTYPLLAALYTPHGNLETLTFARGQNNSPDPHSAMYML